MYCEKCGTKNDVDANFCGKCGHKLESENNICSSLKEIPRNTKIAMGVVLIVVVASFITLGVLLNNPIKKVEDYLLSYYDNYGQNNNKELVEIGKVLKSNLSHKRILESIKDTTHKAMNRWIKNFNIEYKDSDDLDKQYKKVLNALKDIYNYFDGLEYMLDRDLYNDLSKELNTLYYSKHAYFQGNKYEDSDKYNAYYYYQKVEENDIYYKKANTFINDYVKEEVQKLSLKAQDLVKINNANDYEEVLNTYIELIKYLSDNKIVNNVDVSISSQYKELYAAASKKILEATEKIVDDFNKKGNYEDSKTVIDRAMDAIDDKEVQEYKDLEKLKEVVNNKIPVSLLEKYRVSYNNSSYSKYKRTINGVEYANNLNFIFKGEVASVVYRLNKDFNRFKTVIVPGEDWEADFKGYFIIYGDNKEIYRTDEITKDSLVNEKIDLDVTNVNDLKIEFVTTSKSTGWTDFYIYLVEPYLYK